MEDARALLLSRYGLVFAGSPAADAPGLPPVHALEIELAELGFAVSTRLQDRLARLTRQDLTSLRAFLVRVLAESTGAGRQHRPLFRSFPEGIPDDTFELWVRKVVSHFAQEEEQPCLFCRRTGTCHVLRPCFHVVCDRCFDGASYSACPVCERHVDPSSPFFRPSTWDRERLPAERVTLKLLDLAESVEDEARNLVRGLCARRQALSPADRDALGVVLRAFRGTALGWLPERIPVRENVAIAFGTLFSICEPSEVLGAARRHMTTATDVLRFVAVLSGADASLQGETMLRELERIEPPSRWWGVVARLLGARANEPERRRVFVPLRVRRFKVARLPRPLRRALLDLLEGLDPDRLVEDMLRHRSYWVWIGQFLHPHEHARRLPNVARAFAIVRGKGPDGVPAPPFRTFASRVERAAAARDVEELTRLLLERPGELGRRLDHALRLANGDERATSLVIGAFRASTARLATPVLATLWSVLPRRRLPGRLRVYWPKGAVARGVSAPDVRPPLPGEVVREAVEAVERELLGRFAAKAPFAAAVIDTALRTIVTPFNERTASRSAVSLPRGSRIPVPPGKVARLFLHWCEPSGASGVATRARETETDLDLSVGFFDGDWRYRGVCSYYQLKHQAKDGGDIAVSAGDLRDAPYPDGSTELVDVHRDRALADGIRYAAMIVNAYAGLPFSRLERAFAGLMLRDDVAGRHFDPRTVELRFALSGANGIYLPIVLDLEESTLHWLDVYSRGQLELNNVETSRSAVARIAPEMIQYFGSGVRMSVFDLALLHAAARTRRVFLRGPDGLRLFRRGASEDLAAFRARLSAGVADEAGVALPGENGPPVLGALYRGDLDLPAGSLAYALFREGCVANLSASDLLS